MGGQRALPVCIGSFKRTPDWRPSSARVCLNYCPRGCAVISGLVRVCAWCRPGPFGLASAVADYPHLAPFVDAVTHGVCDYHRASFFNSRSGCSSSEAVKFPPAGEPRTPCLPDDAGREFSFSSGARAVRVRRLVHCNASDVSQRHAGRLQRVVPCPAPSLSATPAATANRRPTVYQSKLI